MSDNLYTLLDSLLAGLVAAWVFYGLVLHKKPGAFERIVQALIYTAFIRLSADLMAIPAAAFGIPVSPTNRIVILVLAVLLGTLLAILVNNNIPHRYLSRWPRITKQSAYASPLERAFEERKKQFIVLLLRDGRRIYGWPLDWPLYAGEGIFILTGYQWLSSEKTDEGNPDDSVTGEESSHNIMIDSKDVLMIEFIRNKNLRRIDNG